MPDIKIRKAENGDIEQIVAIWRKDLIEWHNKLPTTKTIEKYWRFVDNADKLFGEHLKQTLNSKKFTFLVATKNDEVVGYLKAEIRQRWKAFVNARELYISDVAVKEKCRGRGVGSALMKELENRFRKSGIKFMTLKYDVENTQTRKFYEKHGFEEEHLRMVKELKP